MKVVVVEPDRQVYRKVIRVLQTIDDSIQVIAAPGTLNALARQLEQSPLPDLVLINKKLLQDVQQSVVAKLIIPGNKAPLIYLAYRVNNLKGLEKMYRHRGTVPRNPLPEATAAAALPPDISSPGFQPPGKKRFLVTHQQKYLSIPVEEISYFFSDNRFIFFVTFSNKKFLVEYRMDELERMLDKQEFFRINRSYLISIRSVALIHPYPGNRFSLTLNPKTETEIIVSRERLPAFRTWLGE